AGTFGACRQGRRRERPGHASIEADGEGVGACVREASVKIGVILVRSLVALGWGAASTEPLFSPMLGEVSPPRPPREIGTSTSHQPDLPAAVPVDQPEQKPTREPEHKPSAAASPVKHPEHKPTKQ